MPRLGSRVVGAVVLGMGLGWGWGCPDALAQERTRFPKDSLHSLRPRSALVENIVIDQTGPQDPNDPSDPYFDLSNVEVHSSPLMPLDSERLAQYSIAQASSASALQFGAQFDPVVDLLNKFRAGQILIDYMVTIGKRVLDIVKENAATISVKTDKWAVLPKGADDPMGLTGWSRPLVRRFQVIYGNGLKALTGNTRNAKVHLEWDVIYTPGGQIDGTGHYLSGVTLLPNRVEAAYLHQVALTAQVEQVYNVGTKDDPIAGMRITVQWAVKNFTRQTYQSQSIALTGVGEFANLSNGDQLQGKAYTGGRSRP